jgi:hypothetical protein
VLHIRDFGKKLWTFIVSCDVCQRVKHLTMSYTIEKKHDFPTWPKYVQYMLACYNVFSKFIKLCALKSATTKVCLNKRGEPLFRKGDKTKSNSFRQCKPI